ncbi:MAG TPA: electron transfer flavoprotein subunit alpha/FixB family protein [Cyclobacteriaceae bacterium]|jgi:electron transfer flavoprotein alpha subunit|nr:electron transfer flavoprotein subunit alpha/FixB family protein [Cyclobacteriaceae bacterium]
MSVLVFVEASDGKFKKPAYEAATYGARVGAMLGVETHALCLDDVAESELKSLGDYGVQKIWFAKDARLKNFDPLVFAKVITQAESQTNSDVLVLIQNYDGKAIAPILAAKLRAGLVSGAIDLPKLDGSSFLVKKNVFSGKAFATYEMHSAKKIISLMPNSIAPEKTANNAVLMEFKPELSNADFKVTVKEVVKASGSVSLSDAEIVVSGGRGLKGPENWGMIEDMAKILGAATACSRPVADIHWRPHTEHVGQTGIAIRPNLYIAIGISGAIQHLAGVNGSKVMVVINKDPEAPFFKAADYGIVGDAFEVVPKLNEAFRKFKAGN